MFRRNPNAALLLLCCYFCMVHVWLGKALLQSTRSFTSKDPVNAMRSPERIDYSPLVIAVKSLEELTENIKKDTFQSMLLWPMPPNQSESLWDPSFTAYLQNEALFDKDIVVPSGTSASELPDLMYTLLPDCWKGRASVARLISDMSSLTAAALTSPQVQGHILCQTRESTANEHRHIHNKVTCRLASMNGVRCPKWHEDYVNFRLIKTYFGAGTAWTDPGNLHLRFKNFLRSVVDKEINVDDEIDIVHANTGDVMVIAGRKRSEFVKGAVPVLHRSPISDVDLRRLLFTITVSP